jgi:CelD/BcsL family acetyltransferase involved in cellulose biosynthesis
MSQTITRILVGLDEMESFQSSWDSLTDAADSPVFQTYGWSRAWLEAIGSGCEPRLIVAGDPPAAVLPLARRRLMGVSVLTLMGHGVSDYLGPITADPDLGATLADGLREERKRVDLVHLQGPCEAAPATASFLGSLPTSSRRRDYERCPLVDTTADWDAYLKTRQTKFRTNLKRTIRKVGELGVIRTGTETPSKELFEEMLEVERASWKWNKGLAFTRNPVTREFLRGVLLDQELAIELWTCRIDDRLAGFGVVMRTARARHYYLPSYREDAWGVGTYLLAEIIKKSCNSDCDEFDFLQGDESYKFAWATHEQTVLEIAIPGRFPVGGLAVAGLDFRWRLARSERLQTLRGRVLTARNRLRRG